MLQRNNQRIVGPALYLLYEISLIRVVNTVRIYVIRFML